MLLRKWTGFRSLPSRYGSVDGGFQHSSVESSRLPSQESGNTSRNPMAFSESLLAAEKILPSKSPFPSQELSSSRSNPGQTCMKFLHPGPLRAMSVRSQPGSQANDDRMRGNSISHLPDYNTKDFNSDRPLARKRWSGSQPDLQGKFLEETPRDLKLREGGDSLAGQPKELGARNLMLEQMESSFAYLEKERKWLEVIRSEGRTRKGELDDKIFKMEMELAKTRSYFGKRDHRLYSQSFCHSEHVSQDMLDVGQELRNLQKSLATLKNCIKTLEEKRNEMVQQLKCMKEGEQSSVSHPTATKSLETKQERRQLQAAYKNIKQKNAALLQQVQDLSLDCKNQVNRQGEEKVLIKEETGSVRQSNEELSSAAAESHQRLAALLEKLHLLEEAEKSQANHIRALEDELLEEKEKHLLERTEELQGQEETKKALQESCENLRESQIQLQEEKGLLQVHCQDLERQAEELGKQLDEQQSILQDWRNRWEEGDAALKTKEEELEKMSAQNQALQAKDAEWSLEKQRLQQLVHALEEQLTEKDPSEFHQKKDMWKLEMHPKGRKKKKSLRQQLKAKTDVEQIQQIRQLSKRPSAKSHKELQVPRLSTSPGEDVQSTHCHEILEVSSQKDEAPSSSQYAEKQEPFQACAEEQQSDAPSNIRMVQRASLLLPSGASHQPHGISSDTFSASDKLLLASPTIPLKLVEDEALLRPRSPGLLSPRPFGAPRPWSPFRERAESPENRRE
ncbi:hypothetical protein E2320_013339, partial [Naja naja]